MKREFLKESGFALITALLLLVGLMLIGVSAMNISVLDERLAGNLAHRNTTYQLAETALRQGERDIDNLSDIAYNAPPSAWFLVRKQSAASASGWTETSDWSSARTLTVPGAQSSQTVQYVIEDFTDVRESGIKKDRYWRITSRATDSTNNSAVVLQSVVSLSRTD